MKGTYNSIENDRSSLIAGIRTQEVEDSPGVGTPYTCNECGLAISLCQCNPDLFVLPLPSFKRCSKCNDIKAADDFYFDTRPSVSLQSQCIECCLEREATKRLKRLNRGENDQG